MVAISAGTLLFLYRDRVRAWQQGFLPNLSFNALYAGLLDGIDRSAELATRLQQGRLRPYLMIILGRRDRCLWSA